MAVQTPTPQSRRAILAAALAAAAATAASALGRPLPSDAANNDPITVGNAFTGTATTSLTTSVHDAFDGITSDSSTAVAGVFGKNTAATGANYGVRGEADSIDGTGVRGDAPGASGIGVEGRSTGATGAGVVGRATASTSNQTLGVFGQSDATTGVGVYGIAVASSGATTGVYGDATQSSAGTGVYGTGQAKGVYGKSGPGGTGVVGFTGSTPPAPPPDTGIYGRSDTGGAGGRGLTGFCGTGIGLLGQSDTGEGVVAYCNTTTGNALRVSGKVALSRSGKLTIAAGHSSLTKTGIALTSASLILATLQTNVAGLFIQAVVVNPAGSSFTIYLNKAPTISVAVAWMAVN
jgi:hypothetical protein